MAKNQWVVRRPDGRWAHKGEGNKRATRVTDTQQEAEQSAIRVAKKQKSDVIVQGVDTHIVSRDSYGNDPNPPKDKEH